MKIPKQILIIEDEKTLSRALAFKLSSAGFKVKAVFNGEDGVSLLEKETFDLILLDLIMPKMDGFAVLALLEEKKLKTPVVVLSNLSQQDDVKRTEAFGAKEFFIKSNTSIAVIVEKVIKFLK
jgi:DNA-binding response OmpR family regulator